MYIRYIEIMSVVHTNINLMFRCKEECIPAVKQVNTYVQIYELLCSISDGADVFVREKAFSRFPKETQAISKVVGIAD